MKEEEIIEGNILIAEFMGFKYFDSKSYPDEVPPFWLRHEADGSRFIINEVLDFRYHDDWNWLMGAVDKIYTSTIPFNNFAIKPTSTEIYATTQIRICAGGYKAHEGTEGTMLYKYIPAKYGIMTTFAAVVEFVKWYNTQDKSKWNKKK